MAGDRRSSARGRDQTHEHADRRRLPGAVRSEEGEQLPFRHGERDVLDGDVAVERACQSFDGNHETNRPRIEMCFITILLWTCPYGTKMPSVDSPRALYPLSDS